MKFTLWTMAAILSMALACAQPTATGPVPVERAGYLAELCAAARVEWPKNRAVRLVFHGHSVPAGYFNTPVVNSLGAYPHLLHERLAERFPCALFNVVVTAIGGEDSEKGAERFQRDVLGLRPDLVTIDYGLNDRGMGLERAAKAWRTMIEQAKAAGVKVILLTPTPDMRVAWADPVVSLAQHADQIRSLAREYQLGLVDSFALFKDYAERGGKVPALMSVPNHPNERGHALVADALLAWFP